MPPRHPGDYLHIVDDRTWGCWCGGITLHLEPREAKEPHERLAPAKSKCPVGT